MTTTDKTKTASTELAPRGRGRRDDDEDAVPPAPSRSSRPREGDLLNALADVARDEARRPGGSPAWSRLLEVLEPEPDVEPPPDAIMVSRDLAASVGLDVPAGMPGVVLTMAEARARGLA